MDQKVLNLLATTAAEVNSLGDDKNSEKVMRSVGWLVDVYGLPQELFDQANAVFDSLQGLSINNIPEAGSLEEAEECFEAMNDASEELLAGATLLSECVELLKDYWAERGTNRE